MSGAWPERRSDGCTKERGTLLIWARHEPGVVRSWAITAVQTP